jgi:hypothetical protein
MTSATPERSTAAGFSERSSARVPAGQARRPNGVGMRACAKGEGHRQLVGTDGVRAVTVIAGPEVAAEPAVDHRAEVLQRMKHRPGRVAASAAQRDACAVPRP